MTESTLHPEEEIKLADLQQGELDEITLLSWVRDLCECTEIIDARWKDNDAGNSVRMSLAGIETSIAERAIALRDGYAGSLQVTYRYEAKLWCDTLLGRGISPEIDAAGVRLVRVVLPG